MADVQPLLVPIPIQALLVNNAVQNEVVFERWTNDYGSLNQFLDPVPAPFESTTKVEPGVHLHWQLPSALTHGTAESGTDVTFKYVPNRWAIVRLASTAGATTPQTLTAWIVQSDYLNAQDGTSPYADPTASQASAVVPTLLGRNMPLEQWEGEPGGELFLTAVGTAEVTFTAYQPGLLDVFAFHDDTTSLPDGRLLTYLVAGWYSDPAHDPLATETPAQLNWEVLGGTEGAPQPTLSVYHGLVYDLAWQWETLPPRIDPTADSMQVAVGYTAIDALAALVAQLEGGGSAGSELETKLQAFQYDFLRTLDEPDGTAQLELKIREAWFGSSPGGTTWEIVAVSQGQETAAKLHPEPVRSQPPLTRDQAVWLAALNTTQRDLDVAERELLTMQWELFTLWWKANRAPFVVGEQQAYSVGIPTIQTWLADALDASKSDQFLARVLAQQAAVTALTGKLPDPTSPQSIATWSKSIPGNKGGLSLRPQTMPPFFRPADPVVLIAGLTPPPNAVDDTQPLPCRLQATIGVDVAGEQSPVTSTTGKLATVIQLPATAKLPAPIGQAVNELAVEAFFADANNAASILVNGLSSSDPTTISALQTAIANRTAQVATSLPDPLQASFAFAAWQQAWSPLYLEWEITWLPGVGADAIGPFEPPAAARLDGDSGAQDNWPFAPEDWAFDGSDHVAARGSEYYSWTAGDVWTQGQNPVTPSTYKGRTFLTPQATYLLIRRLEDYVKLHPDKEFSEIEALIEEIGATRFLSQALSGFNDAFVMRSLQHTLPPTPQAMADAVGDQFHGVPDPTPGNQDFSFGGGAPFFFPVRGGFFQFEKLHLIDGFGQLLDLTQANHGGAQPPSGGWPPESFFPIQGPGLAPSASSGIATPQRRLNQAPRVAQPARLDLRLLAADDDRHEVGLFPETNPVCGWFLPNQLDQSIAVYERAGEPLGELLVLTNESGEETVTWLSAPGATTPVTDPEQIENRHLREALVPFTESTGGIPLAERPAAFRALFASIDESLWTVEPISGRGDQDLAVLIGRPLALVRAELQLELYGRPAVNQSWRDTLQAQTANLERVEFPIRLGSVELLDDGLIGYFTENVYSTFNAVHASATATSPYVDPVGPGNYLSLAFDYPDYTRQRVTLLLDPRGIVHATTGILPTATLALPAQFFEPALDRMAVTFRIGPLLTDAQTIRVPQPAEQHGTWSWIRRTGPGTAASDWETDPIVAANAKARLPDSPPHLIDGWLKFTPEPPDPRRKDPE